MLATRFWREPFLADLGMVDNVFNRVLGTVGNGSRVTGFVPVLDVRETEDEYLVLVDVPGVKKEDVSIELNDHELTISGVRTPVETGGVVRAERPYGSFVRSLTLPQGVDVEKIVADYQDGVLALRVPKPAEAKPKKIEIGSTQKALSS